MREIGFTHIHAFPYSIREGTPAATMSDQVPEAVKKTRVALLNGLSQSGYEAYAKSRIGKPGEILIEKEENGYYMGLTNEYVNGKVKSDGLHKIGDLIGGTVVGLEDNYLIIE